MTKQSERKEKTRASLAASASRAFRAHGFWGVGIDAIAKGAQATSGAFYAHLGSKQQAFTEVLEVGLQEVVDAIPVFQHEYGEGWLAAFAEYYLGQEHRNDLECGCAMAALTPEVIRSTPEAKALYEKYMREIAALMAKGLKGEAALDRAWLILNTLIGALSVARALNTREAIERSTSFTLRAVKAMAER